MPECQNRRKKHQTPANPQNRATSVKVECSLSNSYRSNAKRGPIRIRCTCWGVKFLNHPTSAQTPGKRKDLKISGMWILQVMYHIYIYIVYIMFWCVEIWWIYMDLLPIYGSKWEDL